LKQPIPFGKYYLLERINVGGMAEVFKAKATGVEGFERMVAVKRILPSIAEDEEFITMFIDEAKIAVQLTHANIAQIFDLGRFNDSYYIALEFVHGKDLRAIFNRARTRGEPLPIPMACYSIMKLCEGLDYAHNKKEAAGTALNLVHRDVSPQNILVSYEGEVKIIDFGIAKAAGKAGKTQAGILKGKFGYMSPEQVQGMEIDRRSDIFGVGICLYELLTGERLFVGESDFATLEKVRNVEIMPPSTYNRRIPEELEQIVMRALARDRGERHQTAMSLHDDLQAFMYTSGNFFGRRDLSVYMQRVFAEELEKEKARDQEYASFDFADEEELTGLSAFDELDPVSVVSEFEPSAFAAHGAMAAQRATPAPQQRAASKPAPRQQTLRPGSQAPLPQKSTLLGIQPPVQQRAPSVPRLTPSPGSIPHGVVPAASGGPGLDMDWDDEELSTQIYDKPEDLLQAIDAAPQLAGSPSTGSLPAVLGTSPVQGHMAHGYAPVGVPSPFGGAPQPMGRGPGRNDPTDMLGHGQPLPVPARGPAHAAATQAGPRNTLMIVAAVLAVVGAVVLGLWLFKEPAPGTIHLTTNPRDAVVKIDGQSIVGVSSPFVIPEILPGTTHTIEVAREGFRAWNSKVELQPDQVMELPMVTLEVIESGFALDSTPSGATVFVDDVQLGQVTPLRVTDLTPGHHQIRLQIEGYAPWQSSLQVTAGHVLSLPRATLMPMAATPTPAPVAAVPTPTPAPTPTVEPPTPAPRPRPRPRPFVAPTPDTQPEPQPEPDPEPAVSAGGTGTLRVQTRPWSQVFVDGRLIGTTPQMGIQLSAGRHTVTFVNNDFGIRKTIKVNIKAGGIETQVLTLVPGM
jgi:serine/threonine protein kinase